MLVAAQECFEFTAGKTRADLDSERMLVMALVKEIEIIGEAAYQMHPGFQAGVSDIPWPLVIGMRHRLVHAYSDISLDRLWDTITEDLPPLVRALERAIADRET